MLLRIGACIAVYAAQAAPSPPAVPHPMQPEAPHPEEVVFLAELVGPPYHVGATNRATPVGGHLAAGL